jgi:hypothetical protein
MVLTSAVVAAIISSAVSLFSAHLERKGRKMELLLSKAIDLAVANSQRAITIWTRSGPNAKLTLQDDLISAEAYYLWLNELYTKGRLPPDGELERL